MPRIPRLFETGVLTGSQLIKNAPGQIHHLRVSWRGATAGDILAYLLDAVSDTSATPGTHEIIIVADAANGSVTIAYPQGKEFGTGIYYKENQTNVYAEITAL